ncbi:MAG: hypothetical protein EAZ55_08395 [Cytophagales bacterium]|nr:MAG: hypothetical protein EAZ55_08395 [Cytophagales bacterium]
MAKLKNIIRQLSIEDYKEIYNSLMENNAEKSAYLLKFIHEHQYSDEKIMKELNVNSNAYYTLRSRLNQKIEEYLLTQIESPRTEILRKVANINEVVFTKKRTIAITTLKKLEKELLEYDLAVELMIVYKTLKKLHVHTEDFFNYSQLYNRHVAYTLSVDKVESLLAEYFRKYGMYHFSGSDALKLELSLLVKEINNTCKLYESHRLYIYQNCVGVFHRLFVEPEAESADEQMEPLEDIFMKIEEIFEKYKSDALYFHLVILLDFLRLEYYNHYKLYRKAEKYFEEVNDSAEGLLTNYNFYTYPARFLLTKLERHNRLNTQSEMYEENKVLFHEYEPDMNNIPQYVTYVSYRALGCYYGGRYDEASRWLNSLLDAVSLKKYPYVHIEVKLLLSLQYCMLRDNELLQQMSNSIMRQIRILGKETCVQAVLFAKILKIALEDSSNVWEDKLPPLFERIKRVNNPYFSLIQYVKLDESFIQKIATRK